MPLEAEGTWAGTATNPVEYDSVELRRADATLFAGTGLDGLGVRGGIIAHGPLSANVTLNGDEVTVESFAVALPGATPDGGVYRTAFPAAYVQTLTRDATFPRIYRIVARMLDADAIPSHGARRARLEILPGVPASAPVAPTMPSMAIEVARVTVPPVGMQPAVVSRQFTEYACAPGGVWPVPTQARLGTSAAPGQEAFLLDSKRKVRWDGSAWKPCEPLAGVVPTATVNASGFFTLTHNFGYVPSVVDVISHNYGYDATALVGSYGPTTCNVYVTRRSNGTLYTGTINSPFTFVAFP